MKIFLQIALSILCGILLSTAVSSQVPHTTWMAPMSVQDNFKGRPASVETRTYESIGDSPDSLESIEKLEYDEHGNLLHSRKMTLEAKLLNETRNDFQENGDWSAAYEKDAHSEKTWKIQTNAADRTVTKIARDGSRQTIFHNTDGYPERRVHRNPQGTITEVVQITRNDHNKKTRVLIEDGEGRQKAEAIFDWTAEGHMKSRQFPVAEQPPRRASYQYQDYDEQGNWVRRIERTPGGANPGDSASAQKLQVREITYH